MEAVCGSRHAEGFSGPHGERLRLLTAISPGSLWDLSRDAIENVETTSPAKGWRAAVALSSTYPPHSELITRTRPGARRLSKSPHSFDRRFDWAQRGYGQVATSRPRGARMGEVVRRGVGRDFN